MSSDNAFPAPVPRYGRLQDLQAALATPRPHSSAIAQAMGQGYSKPSTQQKGIASLASTGIRLKRAFAGRRKKSEDATTLFSSVASTSTASQPESSAAATGVLGSSSQHSTGAGAVPPSKVTTASPTPSRKTKLTLKLITQVLPSSSKKSETSPDSQPPPPPPKPATMQTTLLSPPTVANTTSNRLPVDNRGSIIPMSPGISSAVNFMRLGEQQREEEEQRAREVSQAAESEKQTQVDVEKQKIAVELSEMGNAKSDLGKEVKLEPERKDERTERSMARPTNDESDDKLKQGWRKSDSTMSHHTVRPGAPTSNRSSRPVSMAESLQSTHTIVPVNKRLSALLTDAEFQMPEEDDDSSFKSASEEPVSLPPSTTKTTMPSVEPVAVSSTSSPLTKSKNRRSMSLNLGPLTPKANIPAPPTTSFSVGSLAELPKPTRLLESHQPSPIIPSTTRETPTLTRAAANGFISPSSSGVQPTGNNIRGRLAAWTSTSRSSDGHDSSTTTPSRPAQAPPSSFPRRPSAQQPSGLRQTAISISGGFAPAAGLAKRAVERMGRAWGGFSSNYSNSNSGYSSSSSSTGSDHNLRRTESNTAGSITSHSSKGKSRRTPDAPSGAWSVSSSSNSASDSEAFIGPSLGTRIRGPMRGVTPGHGRIVFGRRLDVVVRETAVVPTTGHEDGHERRLDSVDKDHLDALEHRLLPALVVRCAQHILVWGVHEEGLFRVNGRPSHVSRLRQEFDSGSDFDMRECSPGELDPHSVASVFKAFLRELPEPILTHSLIPYFEAALSQENAANAENQASSSPHKNTPRGPTLPSGPKSGLTGLRKPPSLSTLAMPNFSSMRPPSINLRRALKSLLNQLPPENKDLIRTVTELIKATAREHRETKMPLSNLLLVFCPSLNMNPPLLRVLCEAEGIWEGPPIASPVLDIKRETVVLDIKPETSSTDASIEDEGTDDKDHASEGVPSSIGSDIDGLSALNRRTSHKREAPRSRPMGPRRAGTASADTATSPAASSVSLATSSERSLSSPSDRGFVSSPPPLTSSSVESLPTASSSSTAPSLSDVQLPPNEHYDDNKVGEFGTVAIADDLEHDLLNPRRFMTNPGTVEFPRTSGSTPTTPVSSVNRRSILPLSLSGLPGLGDSGSNSMPSSPAKRLKKPSLHMLFTKRSASPLPSVRPTGGPSISAPSLSPYISRTDSDSPISTPLTATTARSNTFDIPPTLDTAIESTPLRLEMGFDMPPPTAIPTIATIPKEEVIEEPVPRVSAPTPPPGAIPIAKMYSASSSTLSLNSLPDVQEQSSTPHTPLYSSHLRPVPARQHLMAKKSTTSVNHLMLLDDDEAQEDWTQSVLIAAGAER